MSGEWLGPKGEAPPVPQVAPQDLPEDLDPGFITIRVRMPKPTYIAIGKAVNLLRGRGDDEAVVNFVLYAIEASMPELLARVEAIKAGRSLLSVYTDASAGT